jgi:hypothetical protein
LALFLLIFAVSPLKGMISGGASQEQELEEEREEAARFRQDQDQRCGCESSVNADFADNMVRGRSGGGAAPFFYTHLPCPLAKGLGTHSFFLR